MTAFAIPVSTDIPAVNGPPQGQWTAADWEKLPDDGNRYEIIDGVLFMSTAPSNFHQWIIFQLTEFIGIPVKKQNLGFPFFAPIGVFMPGCEPVQPDFLVVLKERAEIIRDRHIYGVPNLIVEILSPGSKDYDERVKKEAYAKAGVPEYAIVDPPARQLRLYTLNESGKYNEPRVFSEKDTARFACLPTVAFAVGELFAGAPDTTP